MCLCIKCVDLHVLRISMCKFLCGKMQDFTRILYFRWLYYTCVRACVPAWVSAWVRLYTKSDDDHRERDGNVESEAFFIIHTPNHPDGICVFQTFTEWRSLRSLCFDSFFLAFSLNVEHKPKWNGSWSERDKNGNAEILEQQHTHAHTLEMPIQAKDAAIWNKIFILHLFLLLNRFISFGPSFF